MPRLHADNFYIRFLADACYRHGVRRVIVCPGSRSAVLVFAFARHGGFQLDVVSDERSAGYLALGIAQQSNLPVAVICTSGTAAANLYPAMCEAFYQSIPLIALTADRPEKFLHQQDGQMIDQRNLFGSHVGSHFHADRECISDNSGQGFINAVLPLLKQQKNNPLPIHLNLPFQEPMYPAKNVWEKVDKGFFAEVEHKIIINENIWEGIESYKKILILCGLPGIEKVNEQIFHQLSEFPQIAVLSDVTSPINGNRCFDIILEDESAQATLKPDCIISLGGAMLSKNLKNYLRKISSIKHYRIETHDRKTDTYFHQPVFIKSNAEEALTSLLNYLSPKSKVISEYKANWEKAESIAVSSISKVLQQSNICEAHIVKWVLDKINEESNLHVSNSSMIRYVALVNQDNKRFALCNRGTSGIDGSVSTAVGAASEYSGPSVLLSGDTSFFYDRNAYWNNIDKSRLKIIIINNSGGGIFGLIDGPAEEAEYEKYFFASHKLQAKAFAEEHQLPYRAIKFPSEELADDFFVHSGAEILEVFTDAKENSKNYKQLKNQIIHEYKQSSLGEYPSV